MEVGFDKEIDAILRKARAGEVVAAAAAGAHLDADEISAFAENALPETVRQHYTAHLADCTRCRKMLSNVILLNSEAETETASSAVPALINEVKTPWYRKLFVFPQLAYTMGALVLLFSGFFGYLILQNLSGSKNSEVSYSTDTANRMKESTTAPAANTSAPVFSNSNTASNSTALTTTANSTVTTTTTTTNSASVSAANSALPAEKNSDADALKAPILSQPTVAPQAAPQIESTDNNAAEVSKDLIKTPPKNEVLPKPNASGTAVREENKPRDDENSVLLDGQSGVADSKNDRKKMKAERAAPESPNKKSSEAGAMRSVGGKTFSNVGGIWFDSALGKQKQKTVSRGTKDYLKLDAGLRSIADNLGGTVVILWNGKAYRIQ